MRKLAFQSGGVFNEHVATPCYFVLEWDKWPEPRLPPVGLPLPLRMRASFHLCQCVAVEREPGAPFARLPLPRVAERCCEESVRFVQRLAHDPRFCFELFRRAIVERDQRAWEALYIQYTQHTPVVRHWVENHPLFPASGEDAEYFINRAFERMWAALTAAKFSRFSDLPPLLRYLKMCAHSAVADHVRGKLSSTQELTENCGSSAPGRPFEQLCSSELWQMLDPRLRDDRERTAVYCRFVAGMKPNEICTDHAALFVDVREVYAVLQNVLKRLRRDRDLQDYLAGPSEFGR